MARINIEDSLWADPRFQDLMIKVGSRHTAKGMILELWTVAQKFWISSKGLGIPKPAWESNGLPVELIECGLARDNGDFIYAIGSKDQFAWLNQKSEAGQSGGPAAAKSRVENKGKSKRRKSTVNNGDTTEINGARPLTLSLSLSPSLSSVSDSNSIAEGSPSPTAITWRTYKAAFEDRWGKAPAWNAKMAGQFKQFVSRVPTEQAPLIAEFYVKHNDYLYVKSMHPVGLLLRDAEKLSVEFSTNRTVTSGEAKSLEKMSHAQNQLKRIAEGTL